MHYKSFAVMHHISLELQVYSKKFFAQGSYTLLERYGRFNRIQFIMVNYPHIQFRYHATSSAIYNFKLINLQVFLVIIVVVNLIKVIYYVNEENHFENSMKILPKLMFIIFFMKSDLIWISEL